MNFKTSNEVLKTLLAWQRNELVLELTDYNQYLSGLQLLRPIFITKIEKVFQNTKVHSNEEVISVEEFF